MILLDVSFGIFVLMPEGWIFMICVILTECVVMTRLLLPKWFDKKIYWATTLSNLISGITGIILSLILNGGWYLVVWFPWVGTNEINLSKKGDLLALSIFYIITFILSLIIESMTNILFLRKQYPVKKILISTFITNLVSYAIFSFALYL